LLTIRLLQRVALGYRDPEALTAMAILDLGGCRPDLPGRRATSNPRVASASGGLPPGPPANALRCAPVVVGTAYPRLDTTRPAKQSVNNTSPVSQ
jgi:hypothetical protein